MNYYIYRVIYIEREKENKIGEIRFRIYIYIYMESEVWLRVVNFLIIGGPYPNGKSWDFLIIRWTV